MRKQEAPAVRECGRIVAVLERGGRFWLQGADGARSFPKLAEAEDFAAGWLLRDWA